MFLPFHYYDPISLGDFIALSQQYPHYQILAGGTDVLVKMRNGWQHCEHIIDIKKIIDIPQIHQIEIQQNGLILGSLVTFTEIKNNEVIAKKFTALYDASCVMGCLEIRNRATIGGNICNAAAGAEGGSPLLVFDTQVHIVGKFGMRSMPLSSFYQVSNGKPTIALKSGELVSHFFLPFLPINGRSTYVRRARTQGMDLATLNLALAILPANTQNITPIQNVPVTNPNTHAQNTSVTNPNTHAQNTSVANPNTQNVVVNDPTLALPPCSFRIAGGAIGPIPYRFFDVEAMLMGRYPLTLEIIAHAKQMLFNLANPRQGSKRGSVAYKKDQIGELFELALNNIMTPKA